MMKIITLIYMLILITLLNSCIVNRKHVQSATVSHYILNNINKTSRKWSVEYYYSESNVDITKFIDYNPNLIAIDMFVYYQPRGLGTESFSLDWNNVFPEYFSLSHYYYRDGKHYNIEIESNKGTLNVAYESDTLDFYRDIKLSKEVIDYYKSLVSVYCDSIQLISCPVPPNIASCTNLIHSFTTKTICISEVEQLYKTTWVDSTYNKNSLTVKEGVSEYINKKEEKINNYQKEINPPKKASIIPYYIDVNNLKRVEHNRKLNYVKWISKDLKQTLEITYN